MKTTKKPRTTAKRMPITHTAFSKSKSAYEKDFFKWVKNQTRHRNISRHMPMGRKRDLS